MIALEIAYFAISKVRIKDLRRPKDPSRAVLHKKEEDPRSTALSVGVFFFFLCTALAFVFFAMETRQVYLYPGTDVTKPGLARLFSNLKVYMLILGVTTFYLNLKPVVTRITRLALIFVLVAFPFTMFAPNWVFSNLAYLFVPLAVLLGLVFINFVVTTRGALQRKFLSIFIGFMFFMGGYIAMTHSLDSIYPVAEYPVAEPLMFIAMCLLAYGFVTIPSLNEAFWPFFIQELALFTREGKLITRYDLRHKSVHQKKDKSADFFLASGLVGVDSIIQEITSSKEHVHTMSHQDKELIIERGSYILAVLVTSMNLEIYQRLLVNFVYSVEMHYLVEVVSHDSLPEDIQRRLMDDVKRFFQPESKELPLALDEDEARKKKLEPFSERFGRLFSKSHGYTIFGIFLSLLPVTQIAITYIGVPPSQASLGEALLGTIIYGLIFVVVYFINLRVIAHYREDARQLARKVGTFTETEKIIRVFPLRGYVFLFFVGSVIFVPVGFVEYILTAGSIPGFIFFSVRFCLVDIFIAAEFFMGLKEFLKIRLMLMEDLPQ